MANATSSKESFRALILEDEQISQMYVSKVLGEAAPESTVMLAPTLAEGRRLLAEHAPNLCVLDINLPDGSGLDFIYDIQERAPEACVVILTGVPLPQHRDQAEAFGILHFMEKPADPRVLGDVVRSQWGRWLAAKAGNRAGFSAMLTQLTTLDIIQLKCLGCATVTLEFIGSDGQQGRVYFENGDIIHAEAGALSGAEAFNEIISWPGGQILEIRGAPPPPRTIEGNWQTLLMNAAQWADEKPKN